MQLLIKQLFKKIIFYYLLNLRYAKRLKTKEK